MSAAVDIYACQMFSRNAAVPKSATRNSYDSYLSRSANEVSYSTTRLLRWWERVGKKKFSKLLSVLGVAVALPDTS